MYPNPVAAGQPLQVQLATPATAATFTLRNALGQVVLTRPFAGAATEVSLTGFAAGLYLLSVQADGKATATQRVTLE